MATHVPLLRQLQAEGVGSIVLVTDGSDTPWRVADIPHGVSVRHRDEMDVIQRELRTLPGVSVIVYHQTCAAEKRRRRKRGTYPDPQTRVFINEAVCEGCGDCGRESNCMAILPVETEFGRKRQIDQSACNKDYSCMNGFCPSFVTVEGGRLRHGRALAGQGERFGPLPAPRLPATGKPWGILVTGVGGTGVVTIGALIGMAAHLDGKGVTVLDMTGLAQKGGSVFSHIRIADRPEDLHAVRIATGEANAVIGGDLVVTASVDALAKMAVGTTHGVVNCFETPTSGSPATRTGPSPGQDAGRHRRGRRQELRFLRRRQPGHQAARRRHRHQPVPARLRLAEGLGAGERGQPRQGHRTQRRRRRDEPPGLLWAAAPPSTWPPCSAR
jgi:indolepyruvate ferredoxin oxidoreductase